MKWLLTWLKAKALAWLAPETVASEIEARLRRELEASRGETAAVLAAFRKATQPEVVDYDEPQWTPDDGETWRHFLLTNGAGQKLEALANFHEQACNRNAILRKEGAENNTGFARGWHMATAYFFKTLSAEIRPQQDPDTQQGDDASRLRERVAP